MRRLRSGELRIAASSKVVERKSPRATWQRLHSHYSKIRGLHLRQLFAEDPIRAQRFSLEASGFFSDCSKNRITDETIQPLLQLASEASLRARIDAMFTGEKINSTETERSSIRHCVPREMRRLYWMATM